MKIISRLSKRERTIFYITVFVVAFFLFFKFVIEGMLRLNTHLNRELHNKQVQLRRAGQIAKKGSVQKDYETLIAALKMVKNPQEEMARLLSEIDKIAKDSGVNVLNIRPQEIEDKKFYKRLSVDLRLEGENRNIMRFVFYLESSPLLLRIDKFNLAARSSQRGFLDCELSLSRVAIP